MTTIIANASRNPSGIPPRNFDQQLQDQQDINGLLGSKNEFDINKTRAYFNKLYNIFPLNPGAQASISEQQQALERLLQTLQLQRHQRNRGVLAGIIAILQKANLDLTGVGLNIGQANLFLNELQYEIASAQNSLQEVNKQISLENLNIAKLRNTLADASIALNFIQTNLSLQHQEIIQKNEIDGLNQRLEHIREKTERVSANLINGEGVKLNHRSQQFGVPTGELYNESGTRISKTDIGYLFPTTFYLASPPQTSSENQTTAQQVIPVIKKYPPAITPVSKESNVNGKPLPSVENIKSLVSDVESKYAALNREWPSYANDVRSALIKDNDKDFFRNIARLVEEQNEATPSEFAYLFRKVKKEEDYRRGLFYFNYAREKIKEGINFIGTATSGNIWGAAVQGFDGVTGTNSLSGLPNSTGNTIRFLEFLARDKGLEQSNRDNATSEQAHENSIRSYKYNTTQLIQSLNSFQSRLQNVGIQINNTRTAIEIQEIQRQITGLNHTSLGQAETTLRLNDFNAQIAQISQENSRKIQRASQDIAELSNETDRYIHNVNTLISAISSFNKPRIELALNSPEKFLRNKLGLLFLQPANGDNNAASRKALEAFEISHPEAADLLRAGGLAVQAVVAFLSGDHPNAISDHAPLVKKNSNVSPRRLTRQDLISVVPPPSMQNSVPGKQLVPTVPEGKIRNWHPNDWNPTPTLENTSELGARQEDVYLQAAKVGLTSPFDLQRWQDYFNRNPSHRDALISTWKEEQDKNLKAVLNGDPPSRSIILGGGWIQVESRPAGEREVSFHFPGINNLLNAEIAANHGRLKFKDGVRPTYEEVRNALNASSKETQQVLGDLAVLLKLEQLYSAEYNKQDRLRVSDEALGNEKYLPTHLRGIHADALAIWLVTGKEPLPLPIVYSRQGSESHVLVDVFLEDPRARLALLFRRNLGSFPDPKFIGSINDLDREDLRLNKYYPATPHETQQKEIRNWTKWVGGIMTDPCRDVNLFPKNDPKVSQASIDNLLLLVNATKRIEGGTLTFPTSTGTPNSTNEAQKSLLAKAAEKFLLDSGYRLKIDGNHVVIRSVNTSGTNKHIDLYNSLIADQQGQTIGMPSSQAVTNDKNSQKFGDPVKILVPPEYAHLLK